MERQQEIDIDGAFGERESLTLHQLKLLEWMATTGRKRFSDEPTTPEESLSDIPQIWKLTLGITRYAWQDECIAKWRDNGGRGTVKVVTGGGKTLLGLSIAEIVQN